MRVPLGPLVAALLLAVPGCSPGDEPRTQDEARPGRAQVQQAPARDAGAAAANASPAPEVRTIAAPAEAGARRCGWLVNPTPGNWWLNDSDGQWVLATQGREPAPGMEDMPDMSTAGWVETNGHYGYGCACMTIAADSDGRVTRIADATPKPLKQCRADRSLARPE